MVSFLNHSRPLPPCKICGSHEVQSDTVKFDFWSNGKKGEWVCGNGHKNVFE
ncbi:MAG: hypothetical protein HRF40_04970 [Nitrososphaera sp.]|jgi:hypothetical protein